MLKFGSNFKSEGRKSVERIYLGHFLSKIRQQTRFIDANGPWKTEEITDRGIISFQETTKYCV